MSEKHDSIMLVAVLIGPFGWLMQWATDDGWVHNGCRRRLVFGRCDKDRPHAAYSLIIGKLNMMWARETEHD